MTRFSKLRQKEVVNVLDGARLGYVCDMVVDISAGKVCAIVVPGPSRLSFLFRGERDSVIPWCNIRKIGEDVILVEIESGGVPNYPHGQ
ncbi:MAG: YlmC/YmxH family sporulation protein [Christensenellales bacterium]